MIMCVISCFEIGKIDMGQVDYKINVKTGTRLAHFQVVQICSLLAKLT